ncbi:hypothetical protein OBBRIDRAFT_490245 [Obba rivulosa]|uniref:Uncharacterized protein n=1 Tax=Obba rivulosa TaxID=1052685 RepID=A0A8E2AVT7_9APHY|nr:hypothetical protein OBBRIDRAFT_490245 [Obba rivulosa]
MALKMDDQSIDFDQSVQFRRPTTHSSTLLLSCSVQRCDSLPWWATSAERQLRRPRLCDRVLTMMLYDWKTVKRPEFDRPSDRRFRYSELSLAISEWCLHPVGLQGGYIMR